MPDNFGNLEKQMERALQGDRQAAAAFFTSFLQNDFVVPERYQTEPLSDAPRYPNDFINILGIQDKDRVVVPVFFSPEHVTQWCGNQLHCKTISGLELLKLMPEQWWLMLNPGGRVEKEFSPWEIEQLKGGEAEIPAVIDEAFADSSSSLGVRPLKADEHIDLINSLRESAPDIPEIEGLYLMLEEGGSEDDRAADSLLIGVETRIADQKQIESLKQRINDIVAPLQIGSLPFKILAGSSTNNNLMLGVFKQSEPIYQKAGKKSGFLKTLFGK